MFGRHRLVACTVVLVLVAVQGRVCAKDADAGAKQTSEYRFSELHMGTKFELTMHAESQAAAEQAAKAAFARVAELDSILSHYKDDSELSKLCRASGSDRWVLVSDELWHMLQLSCEYSRRSGGTFDVTMGPLVQLWRRSGRRGELPSELLLSEARERVGYRFIDFDAANQRVRLAKRDMRLDFGGIGKGYAADEALRVLRAHGVRRALADASGNFMAGEAPPGKSAWTLAIENIGTDENAALPRLAIANAGVATSGDRHQFVEIGGKRYSHIIDPRTGLGITTPSSVTVIAADATAADALATAVSVLGPKAGLELIEKTPGAAALIVRVEDGKTKTYRSERLDQWLKSSETQP
jgi:thiamine biosynthesis lipoprotein